MSVALSFASRILKGDTEDYLRFLTRGGSCAPIDQLIEAGADPRGEQVYNDAFRYFEETLDQFEKLMEEIWFSASNSSFYKIRCVQRKEHNGFFSYFDCNFHKIDLD